MVLFRNRLRSVLPALIVLFSLLICNSSLFAADWEYPDPEHLSWTLGDIIDMAFNGDTIYIMPSVSLIDTSDAVNGADSDGNFTLGGKAIKLVNYTNDPNSCTLVNQNDSGNSSIYITENNAVGGLIKGFTIRSHPTFDGNGGAMSIKASITVENCIFSGCQAQYGGAVNVAAGSKPMFINCIFDSNDAQQGGAVFVQQESMPQFKNCLFKGNDVGGGTLANPAAGSVMYLDGSGSTLVNCTITNTNDTLRGMIRQDAPVTPLIISNCIIDAGGGIAINYSAGLETPHPAIENTYINGSYDWQGGAVANVYEPTRVMVKDDIAVVAGLPVAGPDPEYADYDDYPYNKLYTEWNSGEGKYEFVTNFINDYKLNINSSCLNAGKMSMAFDFENEKRPFYLKSKSDIGYDEFSFCEIENITGGSYWFDIDLTEDNHDEDDEPFTGSELNPQEIYTKFQTGKVLFYRITPIPPVVGQENAGRTGMMELWTEDSDVDLLGVLAYDCKWDDVIMSDGKNGTWLNFHMYYPYTRTNSTYYLAVVNQGDSDGTFNLYGKITIDDYPNNCTVAIDETSLLPLGTGTFESTYFDALPGGSGSGPTEIHLPNEPNSGVAEAEGNIDFLRDEDVYILDFDNNMKGTLVLTARTIMIPDPQNPPNDMEVLLSETTTPKDIEVVVKMKNDDGDYDVVAESYGSESLLIIHNNTGEPCYVTVAKADNREFTGVIPYSMTTRYYPEDEVEDGTINEIILNGSDKEGYITFPGDQDTYVFDVPEPGGTLDSVYTTGCTGASSIVLYNSQLEAIQTNGVSINDNYEITQAEVKDEDGALVEGDIFLRPGTYSLKVVAYEGHTEPFKYEVGINFTLANSSDDVHAGYWGLATFLDAWEGSPELFFETSTGNINASDDLDFFRVDTHYPATLDVMAVSSGPVSAVLMDFKGNVLGVSSDIRTTNPACLNDALFIEPGSIENPSTGRIVMALEKGIYYIKLYSESAASYPLGYQIAVDLDDHPDTPTGSELPPANWAFSKIDGHIETVTAAGCSGDSHDVDVFRLDVTTENEFRIFTTGESDTAGRIMQCNNAPACDSWTEYTVIPSRDIQDYDDSGNFVFGFLQSGTTSPDPWADPEGSDFGINLPVGTYAVEVSMNSSADTGDYAIYFIQKDDHCNRYDCSAGPTPLQYSTSEQTQSGIIEIPGDRDYFIYQPTDDGRLVLESQNDKPHIVFKLMDSENKRLTYSSSGTLTFDITAGTYYISVNPEFALNTGNYSFTYEFTQEDPYDDVPTDNDGEGGTSGNDFAQARALGVTMILNKGYASYADCAVDLEGDYDYYKFTLSSAGSLIVYTTGTTDTYGYLFREDGNMYNLVMSDDDGRVEEDGRNFEINYYAMNAGDYFVKVRGYSPKETGAYALFIEFTAGDADDHGDECETATPVRVDPGTWDGDHIYFDNSEIGIPGDNDYFKIVAGPDSLSNGTLTVYTNDADVDTFGYLKDLVCGTLDLNDNGPSDGENFRITYTTDCKPDETSNCTLGGSDCDVCIPQVYHVLARSYHGTETGSYDLHVESNGSFVESDGTTEIHIGASGTHYVGFNSPGHVSYLATSVTGSSLLGTFMDGNGDVLEREVNVGGIDTIEVLQNKDITGGFKIAGLERGLHFLKIDGPTGSFDLTLICKAYGFMELGTGVGSFSQSIGNFSIESRGTGFQAGATDDDGFIAYQVFDAGFDLIAKVTFASTPVNGSMGGLIVRELDSDFTETNQRYVFSGLEYDGGYNVITRFRRFNTYNVPGGAENATTPVNAANGYYVRLHYGGNGSSIITSYSSDGHAWYYVNGDDERIFNETIPPVHLVPPLYVGFAAASGDGGERTVNFTNIEFIELKLGEE